MISNSSSVEDNNWDKDLHLIQRHLNTSVYKTTGKIPFEALYGYIPRFNEGLIRELTSSKKLIEFHLMSKTKYERTLRSNRKNSKTGTMKTV